MVTRDNPVWEHLVKIVSDETGVPADLVTSWTAEHDGGAPVVTLQFEGVATVSVERWNEMVDQAEEAAKE